MRFFPIVILFFSVQFLNAQDTLVLCKRNNETKTIKIPLEEFEIKIITKHSKRHKALIAGFTDSTLLIRKRSKDPDKGVYIAAAKRKYRKLLRSKDWSDQQHDSIKDLRQKAIDRIYYPKELYMNISDLKKIKMNNHHRTDKRKLIKRIENLFIGTLIVFSLTFSFLVIGYPVVGLITFCAVIAEIPIVMIAEYSRLDMVNDWKIKSTIKN